MLFCNEFPICTIFTGDQCRRFHTVPGGGVSGFSSRKLIGCSILKAPENLFESNSTLNCQFVLFSSEIPLRRRSPRKLVGFSVLKAQENPFPKVKFTKFRNEFSILYHLHQRFHASTNCKFLQVAHFPDCHQRKGGYSPPAPPPHTPLGTLMHGRHSILNCGKDSMWARCSQGSRELAPLWGL